MPGKEYMSVTKIPWKPEDYRLDGSDYIFSIVLEIPEMYYVVPTKDFAFVYIWNKGLARVKNDFSRLSKEETDYLVFLIRRDLE